MTPPKADPALSRKERTMDFVTIYARGILHCRVCATKTTSVEEIEAEVNRQNPINLNRAWKVDTAPPLRDGAANPHPCEHDPENKLHYLMICWK